MGSILFWIVVGIISGALAKMVVPDEGPGGVLGDFVIGIVGAVLGGWLYSSVFGYNYGGWLASTAVAFIGAVALLVIMHSVNKRRAMM